MAENVFDELKTEVEKILGFVPAENQASLGAALENAAKNVSEAAMNNPATVGTVAKAQIPIVAGDALDTLNATVNQALRKYAESVGGQSLGDEVDTDVVMPILNFVTSNAKSFLIGLFTKPKTA